MTRHVRWLHGGEAAVVRFEGDALVFRSTTPSPPGSRIEGRLESDPNVRVRVKVHGCRRQDEGDYVLDTRPLDMTRAIRTRIEALQNA